jgi:hypothetical protein
MIETVRVKLSGRLSNELVSIGDSTFLSLERAPAAAGVTVRVGDVSAPAVPMIPGRSLTGCDPFDRIYVSTDVKAGELVFLAARNGMVQDGPVRAAGVVRAVFGASSTVSAPVFVGAGKFFALGKPAQWYNGPGGDGANPLVFTFEAAATPDGVWLPVYLEDGSRLEVPAGTANGDPRAISLDAFAVALAPYEWVRVTASVSTGPLHIRAPTLDFYFQG